MLSPSNILKLSIMQAENVSILTDSQSQSFLLQGVLSTLSTIGEKIANYAILSDFITLDNL